MSTIPKSMHASVLTPELEVRVVECSTPTPATDEVLIRVGSVGVCGSDVHFYREGRLGDFVVEKPMVLGHEAGGTIVAVGSGVDASRVGQRVSIEPQRPDLTSSESLAGRYNLDPSMEFYATPPIDGAFAEYVTIQSHFAHTVSDTVSDDAAGLMEPLSVGIATARKAAITVGQRVLISGCGPIGLVLAQVSRAYGASEIIMTDLDQSRRHTALQFGATAVCDPRTEDVTGLGVDVFLEASGAASAVQAGIRALRPAGTAVLVGMGASEVLVPLPVIQNRELTVTGIFRYANTWPTAIGMVVRGLIDLDGLVTGHFGLEQVREALESTVLPGALKSMVVPAQK